VRAFYNSDTRGPSRSTQVIAALHRHDYKGWNKAMVGAFKKGANAYLAGADLSACPYQDKRKLSGGLSWSRAFMGAWRDGWFLAHKTLTGLDHE
jgi:hypothetical protein